MKTMSAVVGLALIAVVSLYGQITKPITNRVGARFPYVQYQAHTITATTTSTDGISKMFYRGNVEIRTIELVVHADEADHDLKTGELVLRGRITATMLSLRPIFPDR